MSEDISMPNLDAVILGDNQFFGINHMSDQKALEEAIYFADDNRVVGLMRDALAVGVRGFMFNTHDRLERITSLVRGDGSFTDARFYISLPYAHKYADRVAEKGVLGALTGFVDAGRTPGAILSSLWHGGVGIVTKDVLLLMRLLVDSELHAVRGLNVSAVFLQNIVTDLLLAYRARDVFVAFADHVRQRLSCEVGFVTMNLPALARFLREDCGFSAPLICAAVNPIGYLMNPSREAYDEILQDGDVRIVAMSVFASGAVSAEAAALYVGRFRTIRSVVVGASSRRHIETAQALFSSAVR